MNLGGEDGVKPECEAWNAYPRPRSPLLALNLSLDRSLDLSLDCACEVSAQLVFCAVLVGGVFGRLTAVNLLRSR